MIYKELNKQHQTKVHGVIEHVSQEDFKWEEDDLDQIVLGVFDSQLDRSYYTDDAKAVLYEINKLINDFNNRIIQQEEFFVNISEIINKSQHIKPHVSTQYYKTKLDEQKACIISAPGGMGKTHYVKYIEEKLANRTIEHLCVYGKFIVNSNDIDWSEIIEVSNKREFVLVIDAFNELSIENQKVFLLNLDKFVNTKYGRLFITYRTKSLVDSIETHLKELLKNEHIFLGVSYENTIDLLIEDYGIDIFRFEDIAYSNNAFCLKLLVKTIDHLDHIDSLDYIFGMCYLIEQYIKKTINKGAWKSTKELAEYLYAQKASLFSLNQLPSTINDPEAFLEEMIQYGFIVQADEDYYKFSNETILIYLKSRFIIRDLDSCDLPKNISLIKAWENHWDMHEALLQAIFERFKDNIEMAIDIIKNTFLNISINLHSFHGIRFTPAAINIIKDRTTLKHPPYDCFFEFAGFEKSPFNCINYCTKLFLDTPAFITEMCKNKTDYYLNSIFRHRLKNMLNYIKYIDEINLRSDEYLDTGLWASALMDHEIQTTAAKIMFELVQKFPEYINKLCEYYSNIVDDDIKEAITFALSYQSKKHSVQLNPFFETILNDEKEINSHILAYASHYLANNLGYIDRKKRDISKEYLYLPLDKSVYHYADTADMFRQYWIGFRTHHNTYGIVLLDKFMKANKLLVSRWNAVLDEKYHCMLDGYCSGNTRIGDIIVDANPPSFNYNEVFDERELFSMFQGMFTETGEQYSFDNSADAQYDYRYYSNSFIAKILLISSKKFFGSLMSNYYLESVVNYPTKRNMVGFDVYDPFKYDDDSPAIVSPVSKYNQKIDTVENKLQRLLQYNGVKDDAWANNVELSRNNLLRIVNYETELERHLWSPLAVIARNAEYEYGEYSNWKSSDEYNVFATFNESYELDDTGRNREYTIELQTVNCNLIDYPNIAESSVCHQVDSFESNQNKLHVSRLILPPPILLKELNLCFDPSTSTWKNTNNEVIVICDNNKSGKYRRPIQTIVLIRKDALMSFCENAQLKYFAFTERYLAPPGRGYDNGCDNHYQIENGVIKRCIRNRGERSYENKCDSCPYNMLESADTYLSDLSSLDDFMKLLEDKYDDFTQ